MIPEEQPKFEIQTSIEQKPFENPATRSFFKQWCEINDSITPRVVNRSVWEQKRTRGILEKRPDGKQTLYMPEDLQLWEMVGVMEIVDRDTFATKPERQNEKKEKLIALGKIFQHAGAYIAQRIGSVTEGHEIARALAEEFYDYGRSLNMGKKAEPAARLEDIASDAMSLQETEEVDRFLAGENLYRSRRIRAEQARATDPKKQKGLYETERRKTLAQFFRTAEKAFVLQRKTEHTELKTDTGHLKPWQNDAPIHSAFLAKIEHAATKEIETPKRELGNSIFRRGMELLQKNMPFDALPDYIQESALHWQNGEHTLREALQIDALKTRLEHIRKSGNTARMSAEERKIADKIQKTVSGFSHKPDANNPAEMTANQYINCAGASTLGGALMQEAGLRYLVGDTPEHSVLFLVTSNGSVEWRDMLNAAFNEKLTDKIIRGKKKDGSPITVKDIVAFSRNPKPQGIMFDIASVKYPEKLFWVKKGQRRYVTVFEPEYGQQIQILNNTGSTLSDLGRYQEAIEAYQQAIAIDPQYAYPYNNLGNALAYLNRNEEAIRRYRQAIAVTPEYIDPYNGLGNALVALGRNKEAVEVYRQAISIDPEDAYPYNGLGDALANLGRNEEAIQAYQTFINTADMRKDEYWMRRARRIIVALNDALNK